ncbi:MAG: ABC transporter ATP-binding protein [Pseudomonadota bacterium]
MSSNDCVIKVSKLSKCFQIYEKPEDRLKQSLFPRLQKLVGLNTKNYYQEFWALKDINIEIKKGETVGIVGKNGSGKSTLLQIICGILNATLGTVETKGRIAALLELGSGFNPEFTGKENIYLNGALLGLSKVEIDNKYNDILNFADIGDFIDQPLKTYSSGMGIRLAFAVAINVDPDILVVDEALSVGDELFQRKCFSRIEEIKSKGATILFVSHSGGTVVELCDRAILIDSGEQLLIGKPKYVVASYQKLLYAPVHEKSLIRHSLKNAKVDELDLAISIETVQQLQEIQKDLVVESFDNNLLPTSTLEYIQQGAIISNAYINLPGVGQVNNLVSGKTYEYIYEVKFSQSVSRVQFGMLIKTISGVELGGGVSVNAAQKIPDAIAGGSNYKVIFSFKCALNPGVYFLNAGVSGEINGVDTYLHRLIDVAMFRVLPVSENIATGIVNFDTKCSLA